MISSSSQLGGGTKHMFTLGRNLDENYEVYYGLPKNQNFSRFLNSDKFGLFILPKKMILLILCI